MLKNLIFLLKSSYEKFKKKVTKIVLMTHLSIDLDFHTLQQTGNTDCKKKIAVLSQTAVQSNTNAHLLIWLDKVS